MAPSFIIIIISSRFSFSTGDIELWGALQVETTSDNRIFEVPSNAKILSFFIPIFSIQD